MYGLLLEGIYNYLRSVFGEEVLQRIRARANMPQASFSTHQIYSESVMSRLASAAQDVTGMPYDDVMEAFGANFLAHVSTYGYDKILKVLGRSLRDFLNNLDNLHEYIRFSYPKIRPPSFFVTDESPDGITLHYRSKRRGYSRYIKGQVTQVAKLFYNTAISVAILTCDESGPLTTVSMRLTFDNSGSLRGPGAAVAVAEDESSPVATAAMGDSPASVAAPTAYSRTGAVFPISSTDLYRLFPFHVLFDRQLVIRSVGASLEAILPGMVGSQLDDEFRLERPAAELSWDNVLYHLNNVFQLQSTKEPVAPMTDNSSNSDSISDGGTASYHAENADAETDAFSDDLGCRRLITLKGQMVHMTKWQCTIFLATPVVTSLDHMFDVGLYITDLSIHDSNRELILAGTQQSAELKLLLSQELSKSKRLEESMRKLDQEMRRTDQLLYQMMPKSVADRLRQGDPSINTCEVFESCTILFSDVVGFTTICSRISPMQVVSMLNSMYTCFDTIIEKHRCYKVETIGDAYMVVGGVPTRSADHAREVADMAFDMLRTTNTMKDPSDTTGSDHLKLRIGIHSGMVVAGVVGLKMPRYCLFGDTVNTASRMESTGLAMRVQITSATKNELARHPHYIAIDRGTLEIKGKGLMNTYWLTRADCHASVDYGILAAAAAESRSAGSSGAAVEDERAQLIRFVEGLGKNGVGESVSAVSKTCRAVGNRSSHGRSSAEKQPRGSLSSCNRADNDAGSPPPAAPSRPSSAPSLVTSSHLTMATTKEGEAAAAAAAAGAALELLSKQPSGDGVTKSAQRAAPANRQRALLVGECGCRRGVGSEYASCFGGDSGGDHCRGRNGAAVDAAVGDYGCFSRKPRGDADKRIAVKAHSSGGSAYCVIL